jgi:hypothetical protein
MLGPLCLEKHMCPGTMSAVCPQSQVRFGKKHFSARDTLARVASREEGAATRRHSRIERTRFADRLIFGFQPPQPGAGPHQPMKMSRADTPAAATNQQVVASKSLPRRPRISGPPNATSESLAALLPNVFGVSKAELPRVLR